MKKQTAKMPAKHAKHAKHAKGDSFRGNSLMARSARVSRAKRISDENLGAQPREVAFGRRSEPSSWRGHGQSGSDPRPRVLGDEPAAQLMGRAIVTPP